MAEEIPYHDGDIVWVKMNKLWWPGEVHESHRLPSDFYEQFKKPPLIVVKFFQEQNYHYINQLNQIALFNCAKKSEYIKKGLELYYAKHEYMKEFPADVAIAEKRTGGDPGIIYSKEFMPVSKGNQKNIQGSASKGTSTRSRRSHQVEPSTPSIPRVMVKPDHDTRILVPTPVSSSPTVTTSDKKYKCSSCNFGTDRINTFVWHQKTHNSSKTPQGALLTTSWERETIERTPTKLNTTLDEHGDEHTDLEINDAHADSEVNDAIEVVLPKKKTGKQSRQPIKSLTKIEKKPKTENKLKKLLDDWSDEDMTDPGPSGLSSGKSVGCIVLNSHDEDDILQQSCAKKRLKFNEGKECLSTDSQSHETDNIKKSPKLELDDLNRKIILSVNDNVADHTDKTLSQLIDSNTSNDTSQLSERLQVKNFDNNVTETTPRSHLRSGRALFSSQKSSLQSPPVKRRGRSAKHNSDDSLVKASAVGNSKALNKTDETSASVFMVNKNELNKEACPVEKLTEESVLSTVLDEKKIISNSSSTRTSRKGKPRRKEEIKLANNVSVAVLVEKTTSSPTLDKGFDQSLKVSVNEDEYTNVVHKKIRYMSRSSTDEHRKSIEITKHHEQDKDIEDQLDMTTEYDKPHDVIGTVKENKEIDDFKTNQQLQTESIIDCKRKIPMNNVTADEICSEAVAEETTQSVIEHRLTRKCYKRKTPPKRNFSLDHPDDRVISPISFTDDTKIDKYDLVSTSNLRQRAPKRYENTRNIRKSERRRDTESTHDEDLSDIVKTIDERCEKDDHIQYKLEESSFYTDTVKSPEVSIAKETQLTDLVDQSIETKSETSKSKTSTPDKVDSSKELDCFDFTEDEYLKLPPQVLNRRKRLPPVKMFELEDIDKIEEQRRLDEEAARLAQKREEEHDKFNAELESLLNTTTPAALPEIPTTHKVHENFPERRAEKDPEKMTRKEDNIKDRTLPPKERKKRIFKYRNRNRQVDSETVTGCDTESNNSFLHQPVCSEKKTIASNVEPITENKVEKKSELNEELEMSHREKISTAHDLQIEIAETLINFPLLSPKVDVTEQSQGHIVGPSILPKSKITLKSSRFIKKLRGAKTVEENLSKVEPKDSRNNLTSEDLSQLSSNVIKNSNDPSESEVERNSKLGCENETNNIATNSSLAMATTSVDTTEIISMANTNMLVCPMPANTASLNEPQIKYIENTTCPPLVSSQTTQSETSTASVTTKSTILSSNRDFSRIRLIEKMDHHSPVQLVEELIAPKTHSLPLKKTVILTQSEGNSFITRIPKKRKSQMDDDIPAFVIERPKDIADDSSDANNEQTLTKKEPKSFIVTKTVKKQITGELPKANVSVIAGTGFVQKPVDMNDGTDGKAKLERNVGPNTVNLTSIINTPPILNTQKSAASDRSSIGSPVIMSSHIIIKKKSHTSDSKPAQSVGKRVVTSSTSAIGHSNVLSNLSIANRPCTIAPAKKASYRKPTDMTGLTQKQIGIDGKGNPVMIYTKITPIVTQTPAVQSQATIVMKRTEPSTSQLLQSLTSSLQSNPNNQFVITSKGALITNKPFVTTTHSTQLNQSSFTNRSNLPMHPQIIHTTNPQVIQMQQHQQHLSSPSNQILIQTKPTNMLSQLTTLTSVPRQPTYRRNVNKVNPAEITILEPPIDRLSTPSGYLQVVTDDNPSIKKRIVRRVSKNQSPATATQQNQCNQQQKIILNADMNHIANATTPIPPLIPIATDQSASISPRKQLVKQAPTQITFVQEPQMRSKTPHIDIVEQQQENMQEILALPGDTFGGPPGSYFLCKLNEMGVYIPIDHQPLYLDVTDNTNLLKPNVPEGSIVTEGVAAIQTVEMNETQLVTQQSPAVFELNNESVITTNEPALADQDINNPKYLINISDGQQLLVDQRSLMALANGEDFPQFVTADGHQIILQGGQNDILSAIAFADDVGLIAGQQILIPEDNLAVIQSGNHDILAAALAGTEAFSQDQFIDNVLIQSSNGVEGIVDQMVYHTIPQPTITALTNETNAVLTQPPIMSTLEQPTKTDRVSPNNSLELIGQNLDESLAVIGVTSNTNVPSSLELPITITNPAIAAKTSSMSSSIYPSVVPMPTSTEHDMDYDLFSTTLPISHHHMTQSLAINESYRSPVTVINSIEDIDMESNMVVSTSDHQSFETN